jgi:hypothetical protein
MVRLVRRFVEHIVDAAEKTERNTTNITSGLAEARNLDGAVNHFQTGRTEDITN